MTIEQQCSQLFQVLNIQIIMNWFLGIVLLTSTQNITQVRMPLNNSNIMTLFWVPLFLFSFILRCMLKALDCIGESFQEND
jgi:hypothetical protein